MKKLLFLLLLALPALAQTSYQPGSTATSLSAVTVTGAGSAFSLPFINGSIPNKFTWTVTFTTAAPGAQTTNLEGSIDNTNWYTLDTSTNLSYTSDTNSGEMRHVSNKVVRYIRCNLSSVTIGASAGVSCKFSASVF